MGWAANPTRKVETSFTVAIIQMGARVYIPSLGRFLQTDPIPGGTPDAYVYPGDPVNGSDYTGRLSLGGVFAFIGPIIFPMNVFSKPVRHQIEQQKPKTTGGKIGAIAASFLLCGPFCGVAIASSIATLRAAAPTIAATFSSPSAQTQENRIASGAESVVGSRSSQILVRGANDAQVIGSRLYSSHALDQMQGRVIYPSVVENTISVSQPVLQANGRFLYYDSVNDVGAVLKPTGEVVTTFYGSSGYFQ